MLCQIISTECVYPYVYLLTLIISTVAYFRSNYTFFNYSTFYLEKFQKKFGVIFLLKFLIQFWVGPTMSPKINITFPWNLFKLINSWNLSWFIAWLAALRCMIILIKSSSQKHTSGYIWRKNDSAIMASALKRYKSLSLVGVGLLFEKICSHALPWKILAKLSSCFWPL